MGQGVRNRGEKNRKKKKSELAGTGAVRPKIRREGNEERGGIKTMSKVPRNAKTVPSHAIGRGGEDLRGVQSDLHRKTA